MASSRIGAWAMWRLVVGIILLQARNTDGGVLDAALGTLTNVTVTVTPVPATLTTSTTSSTIVLPAEISTTTALGLLTTATQPPSATTSTTFTQASTSLPSLTFSTTATPDCTSKATGDIQNTLHLCLLTAGPTLSKACSCVHVFKESLGVCKDSAAAAAALLQMKDELPQEANASCAVASSEAPIVMGKDQCKQLVASEGSKFNTCMLLPPASHEQGCSCMKSFNESIAMCRDVEAVKPLLDNYISQQPQSRIAGCVDAIYTIEGAFQMAVPDPFDFMRKVAEAKKSIEQVLAAAAGVPPDSITAIVYNMVGRRLLQGAFPRRLCCSGVAAPNIGVNFSTSAATNLPASKLASITPQALSANLNAALAPAISLPAGQQVAVTNIAPTLMNGKAISPITATTTSAPATMTTTTTSTTTEESSFTFCGMGWTQLIFLVLGLILCGACLIGGAFFYEGRKKAAQKKKRGAELHRMTMPEMEPLKQAEADVQVAPDAHTSAPISGLTAPSLSRADAEPVRWAVPATTTPQGSRAPSFMPPVAQGSVVPVTVTPTLVPSYTRAAEPIPIQTVPVVTTAALPTQPALGSYQVPATAAGATLVQTVPTVPTTMPQIPTTSADAAAIATANQLFSTMDRNGDGVITRAEFNRAMGR